LQIRGLTHEFHFVDPFWQLASRLGFLILSIGLLIASDDIGSCQRVPNARRMAVGSFGASFSDRCFFLRRQPNVLAFGEGNSYRADSRT
jgi:hypothetical protein